MTKTGRFSAANPKISQSPTGRLSISQPNIQNIPIHTPEGDAIKQAFLWPQHHAPMDCAFGDLTVRTGFFKSVPDSLVEVYHKTGWMVVAPWGRWWPQVLMWHCGCKEFYHGQ